MQLDIPAEVNKRLKIYTLQQDLQTLKLAVIQILKENGAKINWKPAYNIFSAGIVI